MFFGFKKKNNSSSSTSNSTPVKTETTTLTSSSAKVVLSKAEDGLERHIVRLNKEKNIDLSSHRARVFVVSVWRNSKCSYSTFSFGIEVR